MSEEIKKTEEQREADPKNPYKINMDKLKSAAKYQASDKDLASQFNLSLDQLKNNYGKIIDKARAQGKEALRIMQFEKAMQGDTKMLIWLGKQYLSQSDNPQFTAENIILPFNDDE
jgi:uncharacterized protein YfbU (UPF0304 family)